MNVSVVKQHRTRVCITSSQHSDLGRVKQWTQCCFWIHRMRTHTSVRTHTRTHTSARTHTRAHKVHAHIRVRAHKCTYTYAQSARTHVYAHIHKCTHTRACTSLFPPLPAETLQSYWTESGKSRELQSFYPNQGYLVWQSCPLEMKSFPEKQKPK